MLGANLGPASGVVASVDAGGKLPTRLGDVAVTFNGTPAPLLYVQANQINAVVPFGVAGNTQVRVQVQSGSAVSTEVTAGVENVVPGICTADMSGVGQVAAINQDGTVNSPSNPAPRGSVVSIWATGLGLLSPPPTDGQIAQDALSQLVTAPTVSVAGARPVAVQYAGQAPGMVAGVIQINFVVPAQAPTGPAVPLYIDEDYQRATIAVQ